MITIEFNALTILAGIITYVVLLFSWQIYKQKRRVIAYETRMEEEVHHHWQMKIGLKETAYYFNHHGLRTVALWELWGKTLK